MDWSKYFVKHILSVSWSMWEIRYKELHGTSAKETNKKQLLRLREQVNLLYDRATTVGITKDIDLQKIFKLI